MMFRGIMKGASVVCCVCCLQIYQLSDAGYYGNREEVDYPELGRAVNNCVATVLYDACKFPGECVRKYLDFISFPRSERFLPYLNKNEFEKFCAEQHRKWDSDELIGDSIKECESIYRNGSERKRVSVYILLKETLKQLEFEKQSLLNGR
jgi:hypothetical protein